MVRHSHHSYLKVDKMLVSFQQEITLYPDLLTPALILLLEGESQVKLVTCNDIPECHLEEWLHIIPKHYIRTYKC